MLPSIMYQYKLLITISILSLLPLVLVGQQVRKVTHKPAQNATPPSVEVETSTEDLTVDGEVREDRLPLFFKSLTNVEIYQDASITSLISNLIVNNKYLGSHVTRGFRVQLFSSNSQTGAKQQANTLRKELSSTIQLEVYVLYVSPTWKVRVGDFPTRSEAEEWRDVLRKQFPKMQGNIYVVPDDINV